jgi:NAD(P)-dependent dehydrogenase (short-subunit alcohol dehydrogenase family)
MSALGLLPGKVVLLVGGSSGIGADTARVLAAEGASLMLAARGAAALEKLADELTSTGHDAGWVAGDVSVAADAARFVQAALDRFGRLDGAFNNAAITGSGLLHEVGEEDFDRMLAINVKGVWLCLREEVRAMRATGGGAIVNTSSIGGFKGSSGMGAYQATKHAVIGMTRTAAHDNGPVGIRVNAIAPGPIETPMLDLTRTAVPGGVEARIAATPLRKAGTTSEVGQTVAWLLSDRASHISGAVLPVDGGFSA